MHCFLSVIFCMVTKIKSFFGIILIFWKKIIERISRLHFVDVIVLPLLLLNFLRKIWRLKNRFSCWQSFKTYPPLVRTVSFPYTILSKKYIIKIIATILLFSTIWLYFQIRNTVFLSGS